MKKVFIYTEGCEPRMLDAKRISNYLTKNKYEIVYKPENADIIIFVTCAFLNRTTEIFLKEIEEFQKYDAELIVAGCIPAIDKDGLKKVFNGKTITTKDLDNIDKLFPEIETKFCDMEDANLLHENIDKHTIIGSLSKFIQKSKTLEAITTKIKEIFLINIFGENSLILDTYYVTYSKKPLFHIRISWGCLGRCAYCAIYRAIGKHKSKPLEQCLNEFKKGLSKGYKQFVIEADDSGAYGLDINSNFSELLKKFTDFPGEYTIAIRNLHPRWVVKYIDELEKILQSGKIVSIDIPLQSSSSRILKLMNRYSNTKKIEEAIFRLKNASPKTKLNSHLILGFPTETEEDFKETLDFVKKTDICGYFLPFSCKKGSKAEEIKPKITKEEMLKRKKIAKKILKRSGYIAITTRRARFLIFEKKVKNITPVKVNNG